jgi:hypothetical protein
MLGVEPPEAGPVRTLVLLSSAELSSLVPVWLDDVLAPVLAPLDEALVAVEDDLTDDVAVADELEAMVQHSSSAGPGHNPGVEMYPGIVAQTDVSMHVPATAPTMHAGAELEEPTVSASNAALSPLKESRSAMPLLFGKPCAVPVRLYCQKDQAVNGEGRSGQVTPRLATQSCAWPARLCVSSNWLSTLTDV